MFEKFRLGGAAKKEPIHHVGKHDDKFCFRQKRVKIYEGSDGQWFGFG